MSSTAVPSTHRAVVVNAAQKGWEVNDSQPLPKYDDILVRVHAVALNPTDWKHLGAIKPGGSVGSDFGGVVCKGAGEYKPGDRVAGFVRGGYSQHDNGAFAEYVAAQQIVLWRIPPSLTYEQAAALGGIPGDTAAQALYTRLNIPKPWAPSKESSVSAGDSIFIWSGAASVSYYAIQIAKLAGLKVYTTASEKHHETLKALGVEAVFDYRDPEASKKIKALSNGSIKIAFDGIGVDGSTKRTAEAMSDDGGKIVTIVTGHKDVRPDVEVQHTLIYSVLDVNNVVEQSDIVEWHKLVPGLLTSGKLRLHTIDHREGGLGAIPAGMQEMVDGKVSGKKIVYTLV